MSEPVTHAGVIIELPSDVSGLIATVQRLIVHEAWLSAYGLGKRDYRDISLVTLPVAEHLDRIVAARLAALTNPTPTKRTANRNCRDLALMLASFQRIKRVASRAGGGGPAYLKGSWEDHWIFESWDRQTGCRVYPMRRLTPRR